MTYEEAIDSGTLVTKRQVLAELKAHGVQDDTDTGGFDDIETALEYCKVEGGMYSSALLLEWLGY